MRIDVDDDTNKRVMFIENKRNGFIPLSSYGDGTKKVVLFASTIASMDGGILLIDEFESSIHTKAMDNVFKFLIEVCQRNHIQLFLTTHSQEALDKIIQCCQGRSNLLKIIMLDNDSDRTYARVIDGQKAFNLRFRNNAELR